MFADSSVPSLESVGCAKAAWGGVGREKECQLWLHPGLGSVGGKEAPEPQPSTSGRGLTYFHEAQFPH